MPVRRKRDKRRPADLDAWRGVFECEFDFDRDLAAVGVETDTYGLPDREQARAAWERFGAAFMAEWRTQPRHADEPKPWALTQFGEPPTQGKINERN